MFTLTALCIGFAGNRAVTKAETAEDHKIADGVYIGNVYVGGMTEEEAVDAISAYAQSVDDAVLTLNANGKKCGSECTGAWHHISEYQCSAGSTCGWTKWQFDQTI